MYNVKTILCLRKKEGKVASNIVVKAVQTWSTYYDTIRRKRGQTKKKKYWMLLLCETGVQTNPACYTENVA